MDMEGTACESCRFQCVLARACPFYFAPRKPLGRFRLPLRAITGGEGPDGTRCPWNLPHSKSRPNDSKMQAYAEKSHRTRCSLSFRKALGTDQAKVPTRECCLMNGCLCRGGRTAESPPIGCSLFKLAFLSSFLRYSLV